MGFVSRYWDLKQNFRLQNNLWSLNIKHGLKLLKKIAKKCLDASSRAQPPLHHMHIATLTEIAGHFLQVGLIQVNTSHKTE